MNLTESEKKRIAVLIINIGSPKTPDIDAVQNYLGEFLMDPLVVQMPFIIRWPLMKKWVVPRRAPYSANLYKKIWTPEGSPLVAITKRLCEKIQKQLERSHLVKMAMRCGDPSIAEVMKQLQSSSQIDEVIAIAMFAQFAEATTETIYREVMAHRGRLSVRLFPSFYSRPEFIRVWSQNIRALLSAHVCDHLLFSFHGLPESQIKKTDGLRGVCLKTSNCCEKNTSPRCYRSQSLKTCQSIASELELSSSFWSYAFQSRLGTTKWLSPYTENKLVELATSGIENLAVACPSFTTDCLETLEEIQIRGAEIFKKAGGKNLFLVPALNDDEMWVQALVKWVSTSP